MGAVVSVQENAIRSSIFFIILTLLVGLATTALPCRAADRRGSDGPEKPRGNSAEEQFEEEEDGTFKAHFLDTSAAISQKVDKAAEALDITLAGQKYTRKPNLSKVTLNQYVTWFEGKVKTSNDFGLDLRLPNLERRWQLRFTSYDEEEDRRDLSQQRVRTRPRERDYGASFLFFRKLGKIKTSFQPRLQLKNPLSMSYVLRFESQAERKPFRLVPRLDLYADAGKGTGELFSLEFFVNITDRLEFSVQNSEEYRERDNFFNSQHGMAIDYSLTDSQALGASVSSGLFNRAHYHLDSTQLALSYTQQIYKDLLKYSLSPFWAFAKGMRFKGEVGVTFNLNLVF